MKENLAGFGALVSALLASVCCAGPLVLAGLGLGGLGLAAGLATYRPLFIVLTVIFIGTGFYLAYRKRDVTCSDVNCQKVSANIGSKVFLWIMTAAVVALLSKPYWIAVFTPKACCVVPTSAKETAK
jgi:mercuric ion transport protein